MKPTHEGDGTEPEENPMVRIGRRSFIKGASGLAASVFVTRSLANTWPSKPVRVIVPLPAGGGIDYIARQCAQDLSPALGQQFYVEKPYGRRRFVGYAKAV
jgi:hypothetical protein